MHGRQWTTLMRMCYLFVVRNMCLYMSAFMCLICENIIEIQIQIQIAETFLIKWEINNRGGQIKAACRLH
jgi:hypothetical protein